MDSDGVLNIKAEIFQKAFGFKETITSYALGSEPSFSPQPGSEAFELVDRGRQNLKADPRDLIALGTLRPSRHRQSKVLRLGIFVQRHRLRDHPIIEIARRIAHDEVEVIFIGPVRRQSGGLTQRCRPLKIGCSIGHHRVSGGSLGCFVSRRDGTGVGILSNNHVLANTNLATIGDKILQPGKEDGGRMTDLSSHVARLESFVPIDFTSGATNFVDAAYGILLPEIKYTASAFQDPTGRSPHFGVGLSDSFVIPGQSVRKIGRTTGVTTGEVQAVDLENIRVNYDFGHKFGAATFDRLISIGSPDSAFSKPGDSGSLIFSNEGNPLALLMAGSQTGGPNGRGLTFACPIELVLDALNIDIYTGP